MSNSIQNLVSDIAANPAWYQANRPEQFAQYGPQSVYAPAAPAASAPAPAPFLSSFAPPIAGTFAAAFFRESQAGLTSFASRGVITLGELQDLIRNAQPVSNWVLPQTREQIAWKQALVRRYRPQRGGRRWRI